MSNRRAELSDLDASIENAYRQGDDVLGLLYRAYAIRLFRLCLSRGLSEPDAEDASHDALLKASLALERFRFGEPMWPWISKIAVNTCLDLQRRNKRVVLLDSMPDCANDQTLEDEVESRSSRRLVSQAMADMPANYAEVIYLKDFEDHSLSRDRDDP